MVPLPYSADPRAQCGVRCRRGELLEVVLLGRAARLAGKPCGYPLDSSDGVSGRLRLLRQPDMLPEEPEMESELGGVVGVPRREGAFGERPSERVLGEGEEIP